MDDRFGASALPLSEIVLRLAAATLIGGALGLNREMRSKPAGARTHAPPAPAMFHARESARQVETSPAARNRTPG